MNTVDRLTQHGHPSRIELVLAQVIDKQQQQIDELKAMLTKQNGLPEELVRMSKVTPFRKLGEPPKPSA